MICLFSTVLLALGQGASFQEPAIVPRPERVRCFRTPSPLSVDGKLDESAWQSAEPFGLVDIRGPEHPAPRHATTIRLLWDDSYFYIGAELDDPHLWATLKNRDDVIFQDNDFEIFIDPDGDTHRYVEIEINAFNTVWDLFLDKPYRDGGIPLSNWDIRELKHAVHLKGTVNEPMDRDEGWTVELGIPWKGLREISPGRRLPSPGNAWRVNFSRVQWHLTPAGSGYVKTTDRNGKTLSEDNWVWSPQGLVNMYYPEMWGIVQFSGEPGEIPSSDDSSTENIRWLLRRIYYKQKKYFLTHKSYTSRFEDLEMEDAPPAHWLWPPEMEAGTSFFSAKVYRNSETAWMIDHEGRIRIQ